MLLVPIRLLRVCYSHDQTAQIFCSHQSGCAVYAAHTNQIVQGMLLVPIRLRRASYSYQSDCSGYATRTDQTAQIFCSHQSGCAVYAAHTNQIVQGMLLVPIRLRRASYSYQSDCSGYATRTDQTAQIFCSHQ